MAPRGCPVEVLLPLQRLDISPGPVPGHRVSSAFGPCAVQVSKSACVLTTQAIMRLLKSKDAAAAVDVRTWPTILDTGACALRSRPQALCPLVGGIPLATAGQSGTAAGVGGKEGSRQRASTHCSGSQLRAHGLAAGLCIGGSGGPV